jgi:hypothetical protein
VALSGICCRILSLERRGICMGCYVAARTHLNRLFPGLLSFPFSRAVDGDGTTRCAEFPWASVCSETPSAVCNPTYHRRDRPRSREPK